MSSLCPCCPRMVTTWHSRPLGMPSTAPSRYSTWNLRGLLLVPSLEDVPPASSAPPLDACPTSAALGSRPSPSLPSSSPFAPAEPKAGFSIFAARSAASLDLFSSSSRVLPSLQRTTRRFSVRSRWVELFSQISDARKANSICSAETRSRLPESSPIARFPSAPLGVRGSFRLNTCPRSMTATLWLCLHRYVSSSTIRRDTSGGSALPS
mmetsp:Transcript_30365/g.84915  ORF Transcript_30365/g.84915 Transcript_30365/m.84915 type:complete len:209 (-) Transcript_30365:6606-7232(-)